MKVLCYFVINTTGVFTVQSRINFGGEYICGKYTVILSSKSNGSEGLTDIEYHSKMLFLCCMDLDF